MLGGRQHSPSHLVKIGMVVVNASSTARASGAFDTATNVVVTTGACQDDREESAPVAKRTMHATGGRVRWWVVGVLALCDERVPITSVASRRSARRSTESAARHAERPEQVGSHQVFPSFVRDALESGAQRDVPRATSTAVIAWCPNRDASGRRALHARPRLACDTQSRRWRPARRPATRRRRERAERS